MDAAYLLKRARRRARLSQRELGRLAGLPQSTVARVELGTLSPRTDTLDRLLRAAGQTLSIEPVLGVGVDRTQIRELLRLSPAERLRLAEADARSVAAFDAAVRR
ncbi:MAG TPA: helix-turn-helix domain-containing protein [Candidatus Limnocylindrales bacterium]|nr:helix-turn-helix domain-containing protein [Candidatus Limnocylindrales bacterium]